MGKIIKKNGYVYFYENKNGNETWFNMGKDPDYVEMKKEKVEKTNEKKLNEKKEE